VNVGGSEVALFLHEFLGSGMVPSKRYLNGTEKILDLG